MKQALQAILIAPDPAVRLAIMLGKKKITIREGHRSYHEGPVMICCHIDPWVVLTRITKVRHTAMNEVTPEEMRGDGYSSREEMLESLKAFYPKITIGSPVTIIEWGNLDKDCFYAKGTNIMDYARAYGIAGLLRHRK